MKKEVEIMKIKCCFCGKEFEGFGNDPRPIIVKERWEKLKERVEEFHKDVVAVYPKTLLDKMQELEEEC